MPSTKQPRVTTTVRLTPAALARVDERAAKDARSRSDMLRLMLQFADQKMPEGWRPR